VVGTLSSPYSESLSVPDAPALHLASDSTVIELGRLAGDTIPDRRWRIVTKHAGHSLQCDALVPGGWMSVTREPTLPAVRRFAAWLGLTLDPVVIAAQPELIAA
jgi:hypothetical protein